MDLPSQRLQRGRSVSLSHMRGCRTAISKGSRTDFKQYLNANGDHSAYYVDVSGRSRLMFSEKTSGYELFQWKDGNADTTKS